MSKGIPSASPYKRCSRLQGFFQQVIKFVFVLDNDPLFKYVVDLCPFMLLNNFVNAAAFIVKGERIYISFEKLFSEKNCWTSGLTDVTKVKVSFMDSEHPQSLVSTV